MSIINIVFAGGPLDGKLLAVTDNTQQFVTPVYKVKPVQVKYYNYYRTDIVIKDIIVFK